MAGVKCNLQQVTKEKVIFKLTAAVFYLKQIPPVYRFDSFLSISSKILADVPQIYTSIRSCINACSAVVCRKPICPGMPVISFNRNAFAAMTVLFPEASDHCSHFLAAVKKPSQRPTQWEYGNVHFCIKGLLHAMHSG